LKNTEKIELYLCGMNFRLVNVIVEMIVWLISTPFIYANILSLSELHINYDHIFSSKNLRSHWHFFQAFTD